MPNGIVVLIALLVLAIVVAVVLPMAQKAAADPFVNYEAERQAMIQVGQERYNRFSDTNDITKGNFARATTPSDMAQANADLQDVSRTSEIIPEPSNPTYLGVQSVGTRFKVAPPSMLQEDAKRCEAKKGRDVCGALGTQDMSGCGVCIKGGTAYGDPDNEGRHIGGMLILEDDRITQEETAEDGARVMYSPTLGECPDGYFHVDKEQCVKAANRQDCKEAGESGGFEGGRNIEGKVVIGKCAAAPLSGDTTFVFDTKERKFNLMLSLVPPEGTICLIKFGTRTGTSNRYTFENVKEGDIIDFEIVMPKPYTSNDGVERRAVLLQWSGSEASDRIASFEPSIVAVNGVTRDSEGIFRNLRKFGTYSRSAQIAGPVGKLGDKMLLTTPWIWGNLATTESLKLRIRVPGTFLDPVYPEDLAVAPRGPLITQKSTADFLRTSPCMKADQKPGKYSVACLKTLFIGSGGDFYRGKLVEEGLEKLNRIGDGAAETIGGYLTGLYTLATRGKKPGGMKGTMTEINDAAMKMFGFEIVSPCEDIMESEDGQIKLVPKVGGLTSECLNYLWTNTGNDRARGSEDLSRQTSLQNTYTYIFDRFSGLRSTEGTKQERDASPFAACQPSGTMAPLLKNGRENAAAMLAVNKMGSVIAVQDYYDDIHRKANYSGGSMNPSVRTEHEAALEMCYGVKRSGSSSVESKVCEKPSLISIGQRISLSPGSNISQYIRHAGYVMWTGLQDGSQLFRNDASFKVVAPLGGTPGTVSLEAVNFPGFYITHSWYRILIYQATKTWSRVKETEWFIRPAKNGKPGFVSLENNWGGGGWYLGKSGNEARLVRESDGIENISWKVQTALA